MICSICQNELNKISSNSYCCLKCPHRFIVDFLHGISFWGAIDKINGKDFIISSYKNHNATKLTCKSDIQETCTIRQYIDPPKSSKELNILIKNILSLSIYQC